MSEDEDYMSDKFLFNTNNDNTSSSLIFKQSEKRKMGMMKRKAEAEEKVRSQNKSQRTMEIEKREEGLSMAIPTHNKGFEMLMKMGYKPGQGVGKNPAGLSEPIPINIKANRSGLGKASDTKKVTKKSITQKLDTMNADDFRVRIASKKTQQLTEHDLFTSQKACQQLDSNNNVDIPLEAWYWPVIAKTEEDDDDDKEEMEDDEMSTFDKLNVLTEYLRNNYFYCIWCGATFNDCKDLEDNCPGNTRQEH